MGRAPASSALKKKLRLPRGGPAPVPVWSGDLLFSLQSRVIIILTWELSTKTPTFLAELLCFAEPEYPSKRCSTIWRAEKHLKTFWRGFLPFRVSRPSLLSKKQNTSCLPVLKCAFGSTSASMSDSGILCPVTIVKLHDTPDSLDGGTATFFAACYSNGRCSLRRWGTIVHLIWSVRYIS